MKWGSGLTMAGTSGWHSWSAPREHERQYQITCHECGKTGIQVGKTLQAGWRWRFTGMVEWYYCPDVVCWQFSWSRSREERAYG